MKHNKAVPNVMELYIIPGYASVFKWLVSSFPGLQCITWSHVKQKTG